MLPDRVSNPGPLTYESGALPIALRGPAGVQWRKIIQCICNSYLNQMYIKLLSLNLTGPFYLFSYYIILYFLYIKLIMTMENSAVLRPFQQYFSHIRTTAW